MTRVSTSDVRKDFSEAVNRVSYGHERIVLQRRGKDIAAIVPIEDLELLRALEDKIDLDAARAALSEVKKKGTIPWAELKKELDL
jgi:prevent-host-death family protein